MFLLLLTVAGLFLVQQTHAQTATYTGTVRTLASCLGTCFSSLALDKNGNVYFCNYTGIGSTGIGETLAAGGYTTTNTLTTSYAPQAGIVHGHCDGHVFRLDRHGSLPAGLRNGT